MSAFHEAIKGKIIQCSICFEAWPVKLKLVSKKNFVDYKCTRCLRDKDDDTMPNTNKIAVCISVSGNAHCYGISSEASLYETTIWNN